MILLTVDVPSVLSAICGVNVEYANHLLLRCEVANSMMAKIGQWCDFDFSSMLFVCDV